MVFLHASRESRAQSSIGFSGLGADPQATHFVSCRRNPADPAEEAAREVVPTNLPQLLSSGFGRSSLTLSIHSCHSAQLLLPKIGIYQKLFMPISDSARHSGKPGRVTSFAQFNVKPPFSAYIILVVHSSAVFVMAPGLNFLVREGSFFRCGPDMPQAAPVHG